KERKVLMIKLMKIKSLKNYGIPSCIVNIWEKHYPPYLLPIQEEAVRNYGILEEENQNLLVIAPTSSGKTFIGEMAAITQVIHQKKVIYLVPLRCLAEQKYRHFKNLYSNWGLETVVSTRARREDDHRIIQGDYKIAVMVYEKFYYFLLKHPNFLIDVSLVIIDEMQMINHPKWGPLLENIIDHLQKKNGNLRIIALSALIENQEKLLKWFPAQSLLSYQRPVKLRKGMVREGIFKYITSKKNKTYQREIFFKPDAVRDNCFGDYLLETVRHFINQNESTLIFFSTRAETRQWAKWLASRLESSATSSAIGELGEMEETLSRDELLELLPKGVAYHNQDLSCEERNLVETYLKKGEIKVICATNILAIGISLPFKNVIISLDKIHHGEEDDRYIYRTGLTFTDIENMGGRAGILNIGKEGNYIQNGQEFGRVIFLAHSPFFETIYQKLYFNYLQNNSALQVTNHLVKKEKDLLTFLLSLLVNHQDGYSLNKIKQYLKEIRATSAYHQGKLEEENSFSGYWRFDFDKDNIEKEIDYCLDLLAKNRLITEEKSGILSPTINGVLIIAKGIKVETYLHFKTWMKNSKKGEISNLELLIVLSLCRNGKDLPIPCSQSHRNDDKRGGYNHEWDQEEIC
ncbi:DEAD/DEAH box helicase, partial [bacterium]|nr:DEAD/DEAH box helicase [bacterium]